MENNLDLVIITGMSGAGKTVALQSFEDMGYYCIDNLPPKLIPTFIDLVRESEEIAKVCLVIDLRSRDFFEQLNEVMDDIDVAQAVDSQILFLDSNDDELITRYKQTRRNHPLVADGGRLLEGIQQEREILNDLKKHARTVIDTSNLSPRELRQKLITTFEQEINSTFNIEVMSFGFKYGIPIDADLVIDVRFLPNPHYITELRPKTGLDQPVYDYVMEQEETKTFYKQWKELLIYTLPLYQKEGKTTLTIAIGCTGGKHRSVALAERLSKDLEEAGYQVNTTHRDYQKTKEAVNRS